MAESGAIASSPARLGPVRDWIAHYERFWDEHLQRLQKYLTKGNKND